MSLEAQQPDSTEGGASKPTLLTNPVQLLAFGFGSGLSPKAPGTMGTLVAVPMFWLLSSLDLLAYSLVVLIAFLVGIYLCGAASRQLGVHDHPGIVWDEFVGYWIAMWAVPATLSWMIIGFVVFRVLDIAKPWPISSLDKRVHGGFGIMIDDVAAGVLACAILHVAMWLT